MISTVLVGLIVVFGAALMGKMLKDMFPGSVLDMFKASNGDPTPTE